MLTLRAVERCAVHQAPRTAQLKYVLEEFCRPLLAKRVRLQVLHEPDTDLQGINLPSVGRENVTIAYIFAFLVFNVTLASW